MLEGRFLWALSLTVLVLVAEVAGGLWTHSLALLSDAAHVLWSLCPGSSP
jgi:cobalt-zinc-cadmium efflux system protein